MGLLTAIAVLAAVGLLFALDPDRAIVESGFPEFREMDLVQLAAWGFRTIGIVVAQLIVFALWLWPKHRPPQAIPWYSGKTPQPDSMPAAAVSALEGHAIGSPTMLASIIEMCQRGTLRIEPVGIRVGFLYRLSRQAAPQYDWERTICNSLPPGPTTIDALRERVDEHTVAIGDHIGDYLQQRGLFHDNPVRVRRENSGDEDRWTFLASVLMGVGSGFWAALWMEQWWASVLIGAFASLAYSFPVVTDLALTVWTGMLKPTQAGALEIARWFGWKETLTGSGSTGAWDQSDPMIAYAVAFNVAQPWLDVSASAPPWFGSDEDSTPRDADLDAAYRAFIHALEWWLKGRSDNAAKAAAQWSYEEELQLLEKLDKLDLESPDVEQPEDTVHRGTADETEEIAREPESRGDPPAASAASPSAGYQTYRL